MKKNSKGLYRKVITYNGRRYDITAKSEDDLYLKIAQKKLELESGNIVMNKNTTVARWCDEWLEVYKRPNVGQKHYEGLEATVRLHIKPEIGGLKMVDVKKVHLQKLLNGHEGMSFSHVSKLRSCLYELFEAAVDDEIILKNPARKLVLPTTVRNERVAFTDEEYKACFEVAKTHRGGAWVMTMLTCALRPQETVPLKWSDVNLKERLISINAAAEFTGNVGTVKEPKTKAGKRIVGICDELYKLLVALPKSSIYVFPKIDGGMMTKISMRRLWESFIRAVDVYMGAKLERNAVVESKLQKGLTQYSCRHTCITRLVLSGADIKTVQVFAGHESVETTLKYYTHLDKERAATRVISIQNKVGNVGNTSGSEAANN